MNEKLANVTPQGSLSSLLSKPPKKVCERTSLAVVEENIRTNAVNAILKELNTFDDNSNYEITSYQLARQIEEEVFEICGKNVKNQKLYREKIFKYIIGRICGDKHEFVRAALKSGDLIVRDFCRMSVKQFEDLSYIKRLISSNKQTNQSSQSNISDQSKFKRKLSKKNNFIFENEEKTLENTYKSSFNQENSGINFSSKSRDSDRNKLDNINKNIYGEFSKENFKCIIKDKINFYKKDNGNLKEKLVSLENDLEILRKRNEFLEKENDELFEEKRILKEKVFTSSQDSFSLETRVMKNSIIYKDKEIDLLQNENVKLMERIKEYEKNYKSLLNELKNNRDFARENINFLKEKVNKQAKSNQTWHRELVFEEQFEIIQINKEITSIGDNEEKSCNKTTRISEVHDNDKNIFLLPEFLDKDKIANPNDICYKSEEEKEQITKEQVIISNENTLINSSKDGDYSKISKPIVDLINSNNKSVENNVKFELINLDCKDFLENDLDNIFSKLATQTKKK